MKKKIIALKGAPRVGKSETVKKAYALLKAKYPNAKIEFEKILTTDITVILKIKNVKIGIESQGDPNGHLVTGSLTRFVKESCQVIICATRTRGQTVEAVEEVQQKHQYDVVWLKQVRLEESARAANNREIANRIIKETEEIINA